MVILDLGEVGAVAELKVNGANAGRRIGLLAQPIIFTWCHCYPDMQILEDVPEIIPATTTFEFLKPDATLPEMI